MNELFARAGVRARVELGHEADFALGAIEVRPSRREIAAKGWPETVEPRVMQVLVALARAKGEILTRDDLIESCWDGVVVGEDAINRCIGRLRKVAEASGNAFSIETIPRVGYRLIAADAGAPAPQASVSVASEPVTRRLRIFLSAPGDVKAAREIAALTIERIAQDYARFFAIEPCFSEVEASIAPGQEAIEPPGAFDIVVLILWSRLGMLLPERTQSREYCGIDGRAPVTGTEWEYEEALKAARASGKPDILVYRCRRGAYIKSMDSEGRRKEFEQLEALDRFWSRHFDSKNTWLGTYTDFASDAEFTASLETDLRKLIDKRIGSHATNDGARRAKVWMQAPFRGLESYEFEHAPIFFGQDEALTKAMVQLVANAEAGSPFLLVLGASGSGKSSLVKAGIVPRLFVPRRIPGAAFLHRVIFRPSDAQEGEDLFDALARRLIAQIGSSEDVSVLVGPGQSIASLATHLRNVAKEPACPTAGAPEALAVAVRGAGRIVLVVDQLEELFTNDQLTSHDRQSFVALLSNLVRSGLVWVAATMRKDFWHRADDTPELVYIAEGNGRLELLPPTKLQLSQMIRRPAAAAGVGFEHHQTTDVPLDEVIAEEVAREPGALPLLSYLLDQLYRSDVIEAQGNVLTYATYERLGRLEGAIATRAEAVLARCAPEDRPALGSVLFALVQMDTTDPDVERAVSRRVPLSAFPPGTAQRRLVETLLYPGARLLVSDADAGGHPTVRVAHEALITRWERARDFVQGNAEALKIRRRIEERYALWRSLKDAHTNAAGTNTLRQRLAAWRARAGHEAGLLSEIDLIDGQRLLREHRADTDPHLIEYIERSDADDKRLRRRSFRVLAIVAAVVTVLAVLASGAGLIALQKQHEAEAQTQQTLATQSRALINAAAALLKDGDVPRAQAIISEVLASRYDGEAWTPESINVFLEARAADSLIAVLSGHGGRLLHAAYSPDGRRIVTASLDNTARIWDAATGTQFAVLSGHGARVIFVAFSPDGRRIVTASADKTARIWDAATGKQLVVLSGHGGSLGSAVFSPDGRHIVTASGDKSARIWDAATGKQLVVLSGHRDAVETATYSPDGRRIVTASYDKTARIWDAATGKQLSVLSGHDNIVLSAAYSADGRRIVSASFDGTARIWDAMTGKQLVVLSDDMLFSAAYSADGRRIVTASQDKTARIWDAATGARLAVLSGHDAFVRSAAFSPDGQRILTASDDNTARIWDATISKQLVVLSGHTDWVNSAAYSPDGRRIVTASYDKTARIWDAATGKQLAVLFGHGKSLESAAYSPDGRRIVTASDDKTARVWDAATGKQLATLSGHDKLVGSAAYSPDGRRIVTSSTDMTARIWDDGTSKQLVVFSGDTDQFNSAAYSPDGRRIVTASWDKTARIWDAANSRQLVVLSGDRDVVESATYSPDGRRIVTASYDKTARIWDAATGRQLAVLSGHGDAVESAAYSPDGRRIVTASGDKTARIWDAATGKQLAVLSGHEGQVNSAAYSPDGRRIVTASVDKTARIWDAGIPDLLDAQITWSQAAQTVALSNANRSELGLPADARIRTWPENDSRCDQLTSAPYDPDRLAQGVVQAEITGEYVISVCAQEIARPGISPRLVYELGRALLAKHDVKGARHAFETAVSRGYRAAQIDLANLLVSVSADTPDYARAVALYKKAWKDGVAIAAFDLGQLYENGVRGTGAYHALRPDPSKAWSWYREGADIGEPSALARFGERDDAKAIAESSTRTKDAFLFGAFGYYAAAAERAQDEDWPDDAWSNWRYRRATLARLLARDGMMTQVADAYTQMRDKWRPHPPTLLERILAWLRV